MTLWVLAACSSRSGIVLPDPRVPSEAFVYELTGLPNCVESRTDAQICGGPPFDLETLPGRHRVPDLLWDHGNPADVAWLPRGDGSLRCAVGSADALELAAGARPGDPSPTEADETSPRWIDVILAGDRTERQVMRFPRCDVFHAVADLGNLESDGPMRVIDPVWEIAVSSASRVGFLDVARSAEVFRYGSSGGLDDTFLLAIGTYSEATAFQLRTCRVDRDGTQSGGVWEHRVVQTDWTMDADSGRAVATITVPRTVHCDVAIGR